MNYDFNCIAGYETEKAELKRLCEIFKNRGKYEHKGAKLPKGIIFYGEAGTGKTLFSKVMASVCGLEVYKIDLGDVENESAICRHIKKTFVKASKRKNPTMIFFDEMDKVLPNATEEYFTDRSKTILTQLLTLIDGMESSGNIVFVATCNYYGNLPETLTRPGRLDKKISIGLPNFSSRVAVLNMYLKKSSCQFQTPVEEMAKLCVGFSCASLETLINECILHTDETGVVSDKLFRDIFLEIKNEDIPRARSTAEDTVRACRNVGAFLVGKTLNNGNYVLNLDSESACNDFFNGLLSDYEEFDDDYREDDEDFEDGEEQDENLGASCFYSETDYLNAITTLMGGYVAEEIVLGKLYDNLSSYLSTADAILFTMARNGMLGLSAYFSCDRFEELPYSAERLDEINNIFENCLAKCYKKARSVVEKNEELIRKFISRLVERTVMQASECELLLAEWGGIKE